MLQLYCEVRSRVKQARFRDFLSTRLVVTRAQSIYSVVKQDELKVTK